MRRKNLVAAFNERYENDVPRYLRAIAHAFVAMATRKMTMTVRMTID